MSMRSNSHLYNFGTYTTSVHFLLMKFYCFHSDLNVLKSFVIDKNLEIS